METKQPIRKVSINEKFQLFSDYWQPKIAGELNNQHIKLAKIKGTFDWHKHDNEDELFLVIKGSFTMELRKENIVLQEGDFIIIPRGTDHRPVANEECHILLFEPTGTLNTGDCANSAFTQQALDWI